jgi:hypothetical protein
VNPQATDLASTSASVTPPPVLDCGGLDR